MPSRRRFLTSTAAVTAASLLPVPAPAADEPCRTLPEAIAKLKSLKHLAKPISTDERRARLEKARRLMAEHKLDAICLTGGTSLVYFTGIRWSLSERLFAVVVPHKGEPFLVSPGFEEARAREQAEAGPLGTPDVLAWEEDEDPYRLLAGGLKSRGIASGTLGMEETVRFVFSDGIAKEAAALSIASATPITAGCRVTKDAHELELMRLASRVTLTAYQAVYRSLQPGMTSRQVAELVSAAHKKLGFDGGAMVLVDQYAALPHGTVKPQVIRKDSLVLIDGGCSVEGYASDISRTFVLGKPEEKMEQVFAVERRAQDAALAAARPGVACEAVDAAARKVITDAGFGGDYRHFTHRVGHGIGMDGHEWPYLVRGNKLPLAPGMTFSNEPGIYLPGEFGVRLEDDMVITEQGAELFTPQSPSLERPFGRQ